MKIGIGIRSMNWFVMLCILSAGMSLDYWFDFGLFKIFNTGFTYVFTEPLWFILTWFLSFALTYLFFRSIIESLEIRVNK